jgi:hypothetical protein
MQYLYVGAILLFLLRVSLQIGEGELLPASGTNLPWCYLPMQGENYKKSKSGISVQIELGWEEDSQHHLSLDSISCPSSHTTTFLPSARQSQRAVKKCE